MEYAEGRLFDLSERDSAPTTSTSEVVSFEEPQILVDCGTETADDPGTQTASNEGPRTPANQGAQVAARSPPGNLLEGIKMSKSQHEPPADPENQFILRLPREHASTVRKMIRSGRAAMKDKLKIDLSSDKRHAIVEVEDVSLNAKLVDLPCVIGSLKTLDNKMFYKMADISQMLVCTTDGDLHSSLEEPVASADLKVMGKNKKERLKKYAWKHGITPPLKNVRKKRFRKTTKKLVDFKQVEEVSFTEYIDSPDVEKEVKRLLCSDTEAVSARWEVIIEGETKEIESQGFIPSFEISPGMSNYEQGHSSSEYGMFRERCSQSTSNSDDEDDEDDDDDDEVDDYDYEDEEEEGHEENLQRELQAKLVEFSQYESKEGASSIVMEIQKQINYFEKKLQQVRCKEQRQKDLIKKVENLTLKNHLHSVLERLKLQEKQKDKQLSYLQKKLKYFLEK
nr:PREDICTED: transcription initiation factor TFIID subunit 7-like [Rhinolophus sinicus]